MSESVDTADGLSRRELGAAAVVGLAAHAFWALLISYSVTDGDAGGYQQMALNVATYGTFSERATAPIEPTVTRAPLLPLVAGLLYRVFGAHLGPLHVLQTLLGVGASLVVASTVARWHPRAGRVALWLLVLVPFGIFPAGAMMSEALTTAFLVVGTALPLLSRRRGAWALAGVCLGLAALGRDVYMLLPAGFAGFFLVLRRHRPPVGWSAVAVLCAATALTIAPWTLRNCLSTSVCTPISKGLMGYNLWIGTWETSGDWMRVSAFDAPDSAYDSPEQKAHLRPLVSPTKTDPSADAEYRAVAVDRILHRPAHTLGIWARRWPRLWIGTRSDQFHFTPAAMQPKAPLWYLMKAAFFALNSLLLVAGAVGGVLAWRRGSALLWLAVPVVYSGLIYLPFHNTEARYTTPVYPLLIGLASVALADGVSWLRARWLSSRAAAVTS